jgi:hypothetical protein
MGVRERGSEEGGSISVVVERHRTPTCVITVMRDVAMA